MYSMTVFGTTKQPRHYQAFRGSGELCYGSHGERYSWRRATKQSRNALCQTADAANYAASEQLCLCSPNQHSMCYKYSARKEENDAPP